jgi:probable rRNA maturation factor
VVLAVEVVGGAGVDGLPAEAEIERLCAVALASAGVHDGHLAVEFIDAERIGELNEHWRGHHGPTDVLSFPIDEDAPLAPGEQRELGDVVICPEHTVDLREAIVHGVLHLVGMDHEHDDGEMLTLQRELLAWNRRPLAP